MSTQPYDHLVKVVLLGDSSVGKTNLLLRFTNHTYTLTHITTIGVDFKVKTLTLPPPYNTRIKMQIWDTAGQQRFKTMTQTYYKGAAGILLVYSVTDRKSFESIEGWLKQIRERNEEGVSRVIVGNKVDVGEGERVVSKREGEELAERYGVGFGESSAKENVGVGEVFGKLAGMMGERLREEEGMGKSKLVLEKRNDKGKKKDKCC